MPSDSYSNMKTAVHITLLALWVCALTAPSFAIIYDQGDSSVFVMNLGEEEQEEQGNKDISEEKIIPSNTNNTLIFFTKANNSTIDNYILGRSNLSLDIAIPPPEHLG